MPRSRCQPSLASRQTNTMHCQCSRPLENAPLQQPFSQFQDVVAEDHANAGDALDNRPTRQTVGNSSQGRSAAVSSAVMLFPFSRPVKRRRRPSSPPLQSSGASDVMESFPPSPADPRRGRTPLRGNKVRDPAEYAQVDHEPHSSTSSATSNSSPDDASSGSHPRSGRRPGPDQHAEPAAVSSMPLERVRRRFGSVTQLATKAVQRVQAQLSQYARVEQGLGDLIHRRAASEQKRHALLEELRPGIPGTLPVVRLNVGGELFTVALRTLVGGPGAARTPAAEGSTAAGIESAGPGEGAAATSRSSQPPDAIEREAEVAADAEPETDLEGHPSASFFEALLRAHQAGPGRAGAIQVFTDPTGAIFLDRDPSTFRHILNYLRGYKHFHMLDEDQLHRLKLDAQYYGLPGLRRLLEDSPGTGHVHFQPGPGVNPEQNRLRVMYGVAVVGDAVLVTGRHRITYEVISADYVGVGLISDSCVSKDQEFHKTPNSCVYYMSGVFYSNFPHHRKEENFEKIDNGDFISLLVDMDKGFIEYTLKNFSKMISIGRARRLRFAVTMKVSSHIRIVQEEAEAEAVSRRLWMHQNTAS